MDKSRILKYIAFRESAEHGINEYRYKFYHDTYYSNNIEKKDLDILIYLNFRLDFVDTIIEVIDNYVDDNPISGFYSDLCKTNRNPDNDFKELCEIMTEQGFDERTIKGIFNKEIDDLLGFDVGDTYSLYNRRMSVLSHIRRNIRKSTVLDRCEQLLLNFESLSSKNGVMDIYFYKLLEMLGKDKNIIELGGEGWALYSEYNDDTNNEAFIRYTYGYHRTDYGKLFLEQAKKTVDEFKKDALKYLEEYIVDELATFIMREKRDNYIDIYDEIKQVFDQIFIKEDNRLIIDLDFISKKFNTDLDKVTVFMKKQLNIVDLEIVQIGDELVIWEDFS